MSISTIERTPRGMPTVHELLPPVSDVVRRMVADRTGGTDFPGPNPVSIDRSHFPAFRQQPYMLGEKVDGIRCALVCCVVDGYKLCVLFDRSLTPYVFKLHRCPRAMMQGTILDGELVYDKTAGTYVYLVFDCVMACGIRVYNSDFQERLRVASHALLYYDYTETDTARIELKHFFPSAHKDQFLAHMESQKARFDIDGIVMMPCADPVLIGRHDRLFKLKTSHTIDFLARDGTLFVYDAKAKRNRPVATATGPLAHLAANNAIVECTLDPDSGPKRDRWIVLCRRDDKKQANSKFTYAKTLLNMDEALTLHDIPL